jgi:hypothetical protein
MVLLENFGAEPVTVKIGGSNGNKVTRLLSRKVALPIAHGIPKFRKESHPEKAGDIKKPIFFTF